MTEVSGVEVLAAVLRVNLVLGAAILLVLALRRPVRRWFGAHLAYGLWWIAPLAALTAALPLALTQHGAHSAPQVLLAIRHSAEALLAGAPWAAPFVWAVGVAVGLRLAVMAHNAFARRERAGTAGPAVVGVINPRLVMPKRLKTDFSPEEQTLIRAHERAHIDRQDARVNAVVSAAQILLWFNPLIHVAARCLRLDQELACDATVIEQRPTDRRLYAQTLLKTQLTSTPLPLGCQWLGGPLAERISALKLAKPSHERRDAGLALLTIMSLLACAGAWASQPAKADEPGVHILFLDMTPK
jgi:beta-lactamase regulating signal transducer with metallopeptidase domain